MSRQTRFARAFEPWIAEWAEAGLSGTQERVMLLLAANMERNSRGEFEAWRPRSEIAAILGKSENTIRNCIQQLVKMGMLERVGESYRSKVQRYILMPRKGYRNRVPIETKGYRTSVPKGTSRAVPKGTEGRYPTRPLEGACAAPSVKGRPGAREIDYGAISAEGNRGIV